MTNKPIASNWYSLIYTSSAIPMMEETELESLLANARTANAAHGITGMLVYHEGCFVQYLEGPETAVKQLYANISRDKRHKIVGKIDNNVTSKAVFSDWSMAFRHLDTGTLATVSGEVDQVAAFRNVLDLPDTDATTVFLKSCLNAMMSTNTTVR